MIDSIKIELTEYQFQKLKDFATRVNPPVNSYRLKNLILSYNHKNASWVLYGSIQKFILGQNDVTCRWSIVSRFLYEIKKRYDVNLGKNRVWRIDWGVVVSSSTIPNIISNIIELNGRYETVKIRNQSVTFKNKSSSLVLYDKTSESGDRYPNKNRDRLLRIELRSKNAKTVTRDGVRILNDLRDVDIQSKLQRKFINSVSQIKWYRSYEIEGLGIKHVQGFIFSENFKRFGEQKFFRILEDHRLTGIIGKDEKSEIRKGLLRLISEAEYKVIPRQKELLKSVNHSINIHVN